MALKVTALATTYGAEISGLDLSQPLSDQNFKEVKEEAIEKYGVVVFGNQTSTTHL